MSDKLSALLNAANENGASDLHLIVGVPPAFRINGEIILAESDSLTAEECTTMAYSLLSDDQQAVGHRGRFVFRCRTARRAASAPPSTGATRGRR